MNGFRLFDPAMKLWKLSTRRDIRCLILPSLICSGSYMASLLCTQVPNLNMVIKGIACRCHGPFLDFESYQHLLRLPGFRRRHLYFATAPGNHGVAVANTKGKWHLRYSF